jgi:hypothetical protein
MPYQFVQDDAIDKLRFGAAILPPWITAGLVTFGFSLISLALGLLTSFILARYFKLAILSVRRATLRERITIQKVASRIARGPRLVLAIILLRKSARVITLPVLLVVLCVGLNLLGFHAATLLTTSVTNTDAVSRGGELPDLSRLFNAEYPNQNGYTLAVTPAEKGSGGYAIVDHTLFYRQVPVFLRHCSHLLTSRHRLPTWQHLSKTAFKLILQQIVGCLHRPRGLLGKPCAKAFRRCALPTTTVAVRLSLPPTRSL